MSTRRVQTFPRELLSSDPTARKTFFHNYTTGHPVFVDLKKKLLNAIDDAGSDTIIVVYGPTGVGKSTLRAAVRNTLVERAAELLKQDPTRFGVISEQLRGPNPPAFFSWQDNFYHLLNSVDEPLVDRKIDPDISRLNPRGSSVASSAALRRAYEKVLEYRRPIAVLLDEAQVITIAPASRLLDQFNIIKSISSQSKITHVLMGTYALLPVRNLDGQVSRRSVDLHFRRYTASKEDRASFTNALRNLTLALPFEEPPDLDPYIELFHEKTAGCIGLLKEWLERAYSDALRAHDCTINQNHLEHHMLSNDKLTKLFNEIAEGEATLQQSMSEYEIALGRVFPKNEPTADSSNGKSGSETPGGAKKPPPGVRRPERDSIGVKAHRRVSA